VIHTIKLYLTADEVAAMLGISKGHAYTMIRDCNDELKQGGYLTVAGKVPKKFFGKKYFGFEETMKEKDDAGISG
jgi:transposase